MPPRQTFPRSRRSRASVRCSTPRWTHRPIPAPPARSVEVLMSVNILMPALSPTMEKGNLAKWLKKEGDPVKAGDVIAEIETDKATMEYESIDDGVLAKIVVPEGTQDVAVNQLIAVLAQEGEDPKTAAVGAGGGGSPKAAVEPPTTATGAGAPSPQPSPRRGEGAGSAAPQAQPSPSSSVQQTPSPQAQHTPSPQGGESRGEGARAYVQGSNVQPT